MAILRNFHNMSPGKFNPFNQRVVKGLTDNDKIPETMWAGNPTLKSSYLAASAKYDQIYHEASFGSRLLIAERDILQAQLVIYLDEIASLLEAAAVRTPELLLYSGFDLTKERRGRSRAKRLPEDFTVLNAELPPPETS